MNRTLAWTVLGAVLVNLATGVPARDALERFAKATRVKRVIGGQNGNTGQFKYLASLKGKIPRKKWWWGITTSYNYIYCGGTIISKRYILSAAHCFVSTDSDSAFRERVLTPNNWHVKAGESKREHSYWDIFRGWITGQTVINYHGEKITVHPLYKQSDAWANDIALIKVDQDLPVATDENIDVIDMPPIQGDSSWPSTGQKCTIMGWGCEADGGAPTDTVKYVHSEAQSNSQCRRTYSSITPSKICSGGSHLDKKGICKGDSGGPLVCLKNGKPTLAGIASYTSTTNLGAFPGVFSRATSFVDWVKSNMKP